MVMRRRNHVTAVTMNEIWPHLRSTVFITGAFCTAWAWDLVFYGVSHAIAGENPLRDQLSFGNQRAPKNLVVLLLEYLVVCGLAAVLSDYCRCQNATWSQAAITAVEFIPSPVFAGKLMAYLGQFSKIGTVERTLINLGAISFAASLAHVLPMFVSNDNSDTSHNNGTVLERLRLQRFTEIVQDTLGFGLGIAWNTFLGQFAPEEQSQWTVIHLVALASYLLTVSLIAFRLAATAKESPLTFGERYQALAAFAMYVVVAFTLVTFVNALLAPGWIGALESLAILLALSAFMSAMVATVDLDDVSEQLHETLHEGPIAGLFRVLVFIPCIWCCCPWIPVLWLLAYNTENIGVKEHWFKLIAMVSGLAASIEASGMLTEATDALASSMGICNVKHCNHKFVFVLLQVILALITTCVLLPAIAPLSQEDAADASSGEIVRNEEEEEEEEEHTPAREDQSLLAWFRRK